MRGWSYLVPGEAASQQIWHHGLSVVKPVLFFVAERRLHAAGVLAPARVLILFLFLLLFLLRG